MNVNSDLKSIDKDKCDKRFKSFITLHNVEVERLSGNKNLTLSSRILPPLRCEMN